MTEKKDPVEVLKRILLDDDDELVVDYTFGAEKEGNGNVSIYCNTVLAVTLLDLAIAIYNEHSVKRVVCHQRDIPEILKIISHTEDLFVQGIADDYENKADKDFEKDAEVLLNLAWLYYCLINIESGKGSCIIDFVNQDGIKRLAEELCKMHKDIKESEEE